MGSAGHSPAPNGSPEVAAVPRRPWTNLVLAAVAFALLVGILVAGYFVLQVSKPGQQPVTMEDAQIQQLKTQIQKTPTNQGLYLSLAASYFKVKDYDKALETIKALEKMNPKGVVLAESIYAEARIAEMRGNADAAIPLYGRSLAVTETADVRFALGQLYMGRKQYAEAAKNLERYTALMPMDADGFVRLGAAYEGTGDKAKALAAYKKAKAYVPENAAATAAIKRLEGQQ
jgi:tetratricopeptide (TPR) repeat protein